MSFSTDRQMHRAASKLVARVKQDTQESHELRDPLIETATVDAFGSLWPSQSSVAIPLGSYYLPPSVAQDKPMLDAGDVVVIVWADQGQNRRPYVVMVTNDLVPPSETGVYNADGTVLTTRGYLIPAEQVRLVRGLPANLTGAVFGSWADSGSGRVFMVVNQL